MAAGRQSEQVHILAVSKRHPAEAVREALDSGIRDFGENYLQEALAKIPRVGAGACWHFIGRIQSNKTRELAAHFDWVQTVDRPKVARRLSEHRPKPSGDLQVLIQVAPAGAGDRPGAAETDIPELAAIIRGLPGLKLRGLMIIPLPGLDNGPLRTEYARVRRLFESLRQQGHGVDTLSMGMSDDIEAAIAEGSTLVRVGTAIFGPRDMR